ncbi:LOW QUALITY PROTEIN: MORC family CW-type zinc finger protein 4 [Rhynchocyon petersi]
MDPDVAARSMYISVEEVKNKRCLTFTNSGNGMTPDKVHRVLSFGITDKTIKKSQSHIGVSGNGFRSSFMRLGKDVLVVTKTGTTLTAGYLSQKYLDHIKTQEVIKLIVTGNSLSSMETILKYSVFCSEKELLTQFDAIPGKKGSRIVIWNIHRNKDGKTELDFDTDRSDILITDFDKKYKGATSELPEAEYSLRAYCGILYMKPQMRIFLRSRRVTAYLIDKNLAEVECDIYKPTCTKKQVKITFGIPCNNYKHYGVMMYHNNRLVKIQKVGCQVKPNSGEGVGVIGVIECNFLKPVYNKQDFEYTKEYKLTISALAFKLNSYWKAKISQEHFQCPVIGRSNLIPDETWVQCGECLKWRKLPGHIDPAIEHCLSDMIAQLRTLKGAIRKYKWLFSEKPIEKRRKLDKSMTAAPSCYSMTKPSKRVEAAVSCPEGKNSYDRASVSRSEPPHLSPEYSEIIKHTSHSRDISDLYSETRGQRQGSLLSEEFNQMPKLVAEGSSSGSANKEVSKGPYVAVVGIVKGPSESGSPIQLVPLNQEQLVEKRKAAEPWHSGPGSSQAFATSTKKKKRVSEKNGHCKTPKLKNQRKREKLKRTKKKLERALAERNLFQQKVEELEHERNHWHSEFKKVQNELKTCNTRESEGLYWSKKHMGYRQAEFQLMKAELEKTKQEKKELKDKLKEIKVLLGRLQDAQAAGRALAKLRRLRIYISCLLTSALPHLEELHEMGCDKEKVDGILYTVLEANHVLD